MTSAELARPLLQLDVQRDGLAPRRTVADANFGTMAANSAKLPCCSTAQNLAADDWDLLFRAALDVLSSVAVEKPEALDRTRLQAAGTVLRECLSALDQLRRTVPAHESQPPT